MDRVTFLSGFLLAFAVTAAIVSGGACHANDDADMKRLEKRLKGKQKSETTDKAPAPPAKARTGTLSISTDSACDLRVNGGTSHRLSAETPYDEEIRPGKAEVKCTSVANAAVQVIQTVSVDAGVRTVLKLPLALQVKLQSDADAIESAARQKQLQQEEEQRRERAERETVNGGMVDEGNGILRQVRTGLRWTQKDNGADVVWAAADTFCRGLNIGGSGWKLPSPDELRSLVDRNATDLGCGSYKCRVSQRFAVTHMWYWSSKENDAGEAIAVGLYSGLAFPLTRTTSFGARALCVRH